MLKGIIVELGDGQPYTVPPLSLGSLEVLQERLEQFTGGTDRQSVALIVDTAFAALKRNYPDLTRKQVLDLLDVGNMQEVFEACMDVSGLKRKATEAGEAKGAGS